MDIYEADDLYRRHKAVDAAAKLGHGIGFEEHESEHDGEHDEEEAAALEAQYPVSGGAERIHQGRTRTSATTLADRFHAAAPEDPSANPEYGELSARDRIRARVKYAMQVAKADASKVDEQWDRFVRGRAHAQTGMRSIVDEENILKGTIYNFDDKDSADIKAALGTQQPHTGGQETDHAAAIFGAPAPTVPQTTPDRGGSSRRRHAADETRHRDRPSARSERSHAASNREADREHRRSADERHLERNDDSRSHREQNKDSHRDRDRDRRRDDRGRDAMTRRRHDSRHREDRDRERDRDRDRDHARQRGDCRERDRDRTRNRERDGERDRRRTRDSSVDRKHGRDRDRDQKSHELQERNGKGSARDGDRDWKRGEHKSRREGSASQAPLGRWQRADGDELPAEAEPRAASPRAGHLEHASRSSRPSHDAGRREPHAVQNDPFNRPADAKGARPAETSASLVMPENVRSDAQRNGSALPLGGVKQASESMGPWDDLAPDGATVVMTEQDANNDAEPLHEDLDVSLTRTQGSWRDRFKKR